jgi:hypothetical protein
MNSLAKRLGTWQIAAIACVVVHFFLNIAHGAAHGRLGIALTDVQTIFVAVVVFVAPLVAGFLLAIHRPRTGAVLLVVSMAGSLVFGSYFHFALPGPDNVAQPSVAALHSWHGIFVSTAFGLAAMEGLGILVGLIILIRTFAPGAESGASHPGGRDSS